MPSRAPSGWPSGPSRFPLATGSSQRGKPYGSTAFSIRDTHCQESGGRPDLLPCSGESPGRPHDAPVESPPAHAHPQPVPEVEGRHAGQHDGTYPQQSHRECGSQGGQYRDLRAFRWRCAEQTLHAQDPHAQEGKARGQTALEPCRHRLLTEGHPYESRNASGSRRVSMCAGFRARFDVHSDCIVQLLRRHRPVERDMVRRVQDRKGRQDVWLGPLRQQGTDPRMDQWQPRRDAADDRSLQFRRARDREPKQHSLCAGRDRHEFHHDLRGDSGSLLHPRPPEHVTNLVDLSPVALEILDEIRSDHQPQPQPAPRCDAGPDWALLLLQIVMIGDIVGVLKILFDSKEPSMRTIAAVIVSLFAIVGIFFLDRYTINKTVDNFQANVAGMYQKAERAVTGWFKPAARTDATA